MLLWRGKKLSNQSQIITNLISEHEVIKEQLKRADEAIQDWQKTLESEKTHQQGSPMESLSDKQWKLVQAIGYLEDGLSNHYQRELKEIGPFVGLLNEALIIEQDEILKELLRIKLLLTDINLKGSSGAELAKKYSNINKDIEITYQRIYDHSTINDYFLRILLKAFTHIEGKEERYDGTEKGA
jgi:hypothetical protein